MRRLRLGSTSLVVSSMVVPSVSKVSFTGEIGSGGLLARVPLVLLSTLGDIGSRVGNVRSKTRTCIAGPFGTRCLVGLTRQLVLQRGRLGRCCGSVLDAFGLSSKRFLRGRGGMFFRGVVRLVSGGVAGSRLSIRFLDDSLKCDAQRFCQGLGRVARGAPTSVVGRCQLTVTGGLLLAAGLSVRRVVSGSKFVGHKAFCGVFSRGCGVPPQRCERRRGRGFGRMSGGRGNLVTPSSNRRRGRL